MKYVWEVTYTQSYEEIQIAPNGSRSLIPKISDPSTRLVLTETENLADASAILRDVVRTESAGNNAFHQINKALYLGRAIERIKRSSFDL